MSTSKTARTKKFNFSNSLNSELQSQKEEEIKEEVKKEVIEKIHSEIPLEKREEKGIKETEKKIEEVKGVENEEQKEEKGEGSISPEIEKDEINGLVTVMKKAKQHGVTKSVYLNEDNYKYIQDKCEKTGVKFSVVLNLIIQNFRENK